MKINTRKLLLLMSLVGEKGISLEKVTWLWSDLTAAGQRSLLSKLSKAQLITKDGPPHQERLYPTKTASIQVKIQYHQTRPKAPETEIDRPSLLIFLQASTRDPHFRILQPQLKAWGWLLLQKGVYIYPSTPSAEVTTLLEKQYVGAVCLAEVKKWQIGEIDLLFRRQYHLNELQSSLSGISSEIDQLIDNLISNKISINQSKIHINSVFNRIVSVFDETKNVPPGLFQKALDELSFADRVKKLF